MASLRITPAAERELAALPRAYMSAVDAAILDLATEPLAGKVLRGRLRALRSKRVGTYRILYRLDARATLVTVVGIRHRSEAYR